MDDSLIPAEKFLQEERERQDRVHLRDSSLIDWSTILDSHRTYLCPLNGGKGGNVVCPHKGLSFSLWRKRHPAMWGNVDKSGGHRAV